MKRKKEEEKSQKHPTTCKASSLTPIWEPMGQGSSLAPLRTTFDNWLTPDLLNLFRGPLKSPDLEISVRHQV